MNTVSQYLPFSNWKQAVGLFLVIVVAVALASKFGVQRQVNKVVGA